MPASAFYPDLGLGVSSLPVLQRNSAGGGIGAAELQSILGLTLWLEADDGTFQTSGGAAAVADTDPVGQWQDQSLLAQHFSQATGSARPALKLNILNGQPILRFDGTNDELNSAVDLSNFINNNAYEMFVVARFVAIGTNAVNTYENDPIIADLSGYWGLFGKSGTPSAAAFNWDGSDDKAEKTIVANTFYTFNQRHAGGTLYLGVNGGAESSAASGNTSVLTGLVGIGNRDAPTVWAEIDVAAIIIYENGLTNTERTNVLSYLRTKYATW